MKALVTGGAGLIGSHIVDKLLEKDYEVKILDNLEKPTHLNGKPDYIPSNAEFIVGDVRSIQDWKKALYDVDIIFHEAATGGFTSKTNQYIESNSLGTSNMFEAIIKNKFPIKKIVIASSVAVYGEGKYSCKIHGIIYPKQREIEQLKKKEWEVKCPICKNHVNPLLTDEAKPIDPQSMYSISKYDQETISILLGKQYNIPVVALRYFVTYGPRQSLTNPYTGVCSIFSTQILNKKSPVIYEDGLQTRDFIYVEDVAEANILAMENPKANYETFNVGTGNPTSVSSIAKKLMELYGEEVPLNFPGSFRLADVRHIVADTSKIKRILNFKPKYSFDEGIKKYIDWVKSKGDIKEYFSSAQEEMKKSGIIKD